MTKIDYKCSIIIPVYNGEKFIDKTIQSCLNQTVPVEIIIINDASKDRSEEYILSYSDNRIIYIKNDTNLGVMKSLNKAVKYAHSDYLLFLGHDDMLRANHVTSVLREFENDTAFIHCNADLIDVNDMIIGLGVNDLKQLQKTKYIKESLLISNIVHSTGTIINKKYFDQIGGWDERFKNYGEWLLWIKLANVGKVKYCTQVKAMYRRHETNITNTFTDANVKIGLNIFFRYCRKTALELFRPNLLTRIKLIFILNRSYIYSLFKNKYIRLIGK